MATTRDQLIKAVSALGFYETVVLGYFDSVAAKTQIAALTPVSTANASDPATTQALANANKIAINAIIAALKA
jgi:hypothetical protein